MRIMQRIFLRLLFSIAIAASALAATAASRQSSTQAANHVVIITLDGFGGWALDDPICRSRHCASWPPVVPLPGACGR